MDDQQRFLEIAAGSGQIEYHKPSLFDTTFAYLAIGAFLGFVLGFFLRDYLGGAVL